MKQLEQWRGMKEDFELLIASPLDTAAKEWTILLECWGDRSVHECSRRIKYQAHHCPHRPSEQNQPARNHHAH
jgi:hypothetical protein